MKVKQYSTKQSCHWNQRGILKYLETNKSEETTTQNLWNVSKAVLRGKFTEKHAYLKKQKKFKQLKITPEERRNEIQI